MRDPKTFELARDVDAHSLQRLVSLPPYYQDQSVTIYHGDSFEIMPQLQTDSVEDGERKEKHE